MATIKFYLIFASVRKWSCNQNLHYIKLCLRSIAHFLCHRQTKQEVFFYVTARPWCDMSYHSQKNTSLTFNVINYSQYQHFPLCHMFIDMSPGCWLWQYAYTL